MDTITIETKEVGGKKQLVFNGTAKQAVETPAPVAASTEGGSNPAAPSTSA
jgi:hypothetical protein